MSYSKERIPVRRTPREGGLSNRLTSLGLSPIYKFYFLIDFYRLGLEQQNYQNMNVFIVDYVLLGF